MLRRVKPKMGFTLVKGALSIIQEPTAAGLFVANKAAMKKALIVHQVEVLTVLILTLT